jgi:hypothetical protein
VIAGKTKTGTGPPVFWYASAVLILLASLDLSFRGSPLLGGALSGPSANLVGFLTGSVLGIANLAVFLVLDNKARATNMYSDWTPSPRKVVPYLALTSWVIGACHIFFWAQDLTR